MFIVLDGVGTSEDMIVVLKLYDTVTGEYTTKALMVQNSDIIKSNATLAGTSYEGIVLDNNDGIIVIQANDYQEGNTNLVIVGGQIAGSDEGIDGTAIAFNGALGAGGASSGTEPFSTDVSDAPFKITSIGFLTDSSEDQSATIEFDVTLEDHDGDQVVVQDVTVNIGTVAPLAAAVVSQESFEDTSDTSDTSAFSLTSVDSTDQQRTMSYANNNSVLLGAIAAAGLGAGSQAAAHSFSDGGHAVMFDSTSFGYDGGASQGFMLESVELAHNVIGGEAFEIAGSEPMMEYSGHHSAITEKLSLTDGSGEVTLAPTVLYQGTEAVQMQPELAQSTLTSAAVGMPSAEMLVGNDGELAVEGVAQSNGEVGRVLLDALAGGGDGLNIDAVLDAVANQGGGGGNAGLETIASLGGGDVSPWHMADYAGYAAGHSTITMDSMALHPDAVQTAA
jgi:hypothetical protein